jgi:squalene synthase HpnD
VTEPKQAAERTASGSSFYAGMRILPRPQREAMYEIYAFCRAVDDIADDAGPREERRKALQWWRGEINRLYDGPAPDFIGLARAVKLFGLRREDFIAVIDGMDMDVVADIRAPDRATLSLYCDRVACAVGRLSVRVFGMDGESGIALAHHLGRALQLTNILRDLDEDAAMGRLYLPREELQAAGITSTDPAVVLAHPALAGPCAALAALARDEFEQASAIMAKNPRRVVRAPRIMGEAYRLILKALLARGFAPPRQPVHLPRAKFLLIVLRNLL